MPELQFKGKEFVYNHHLSVPFRPLIPDAEKSVGEPSLSGNLIIHGDNLHALKALLPMYAGKVDCIFIDPPYNTGNEGWSYNDNVNSPMMKEWLSSNPINGEDMLRHDKWCAMMWPRLVLLRELLSESGSLWMTIDDNETANARKMLDEIFGENNFIGTVIWQKADSPKMDSKRFSSSHDYLISFAKSQDNVIFHRLGLDRKIPARHYTLTADDGRRYYTKPLRAMGGQGETREARPKLYYPIEAPDGTLVHPKLQDGTDGAWRWSPKKLKREASRIEWTKTIHGWAPYFRIYDDPSKGTPAQTIFPHREVGSSRTAKAQLKAYFGRRASFQTPKPRGLLSRILEIATDKTSLVLDSFAGSGTTGDAVIRKNHTDGGSRRFIMIESETYADDLTAERMRKLTTGYSYRGLFTEQLLRRKLTWRDLSKSDELKSAVDQIAGASAGRFDQIRIIVKDDQLQVDGLRKIVKRVDGTEGAFTYCTLGEPLNLDQMLSGEVLPDYLALGAWLFHTATGEVFSPVEADETSGFLGESSAYYCWLVYKPELTFLKSSEAALTLSLAERIAAAKPKGKKYLVFAPAKYVPNNKLLPMGVEYAPLPFALYRIERG